MRRNATAKALRAVASQRVVQINDRVTSLREQGSGSRAASSARRSAAARGPRTNAVSATHRVIAELDGRGQIDSHAAICLRAAIADVLAGPAAAIIVDLRDLTAIDDDAVAVLTQSHAACRARGVHLALLIGVRDLQDKLPYALARAGLDTRSHITGNDRRSAARPRDGAQNLQPSHVTEGRKVKTRTRRG